VERYYVCHCYFRTGYSYSYHHYVVVTEKEKPNSQHSIHIDILLILLCMEFFFYDGGDNDSLGQATTKVFVVGPHPLYQQYYCCYYYVICFNSFCHDICNTIVADTYLIWICTVVAMISCRASCSL
jgi:hypothetical protein